MSPLTVSLTTASTWVPWWEMAAPSEALTVTVDFTGTGEFGLLAGPGGTPAKWTTDKRVNTSKSGRLTVTLPPTTGGLWRLGLYQRGGSATARVTVTTAASSAPSKAGVPVPLYRLTTQVGDLPAGTVIRRRDDTLTDTRHITSQFWAAPLTSTAVAGTSVAWSKRLADQTSSVINGTPFGNAYTGQNGTKTSTNSYSVAIYQVPLNTPRVPVWVRSDKYYNNNGVRVSLRDQFAAVPLPDASLLPNGRIEPDGTDGACIIICGKEAWEPWRFSSAADASKYSGDTTTPDGYGWACQQGGYIADITTHPGWWAGSGDENAPKRGGDFGVSASGMSYLGPILTGSDFYASTIRHPLSVALPETGGTGTVDYPRFVFPATRGDRLGNLRDAPDGTSGDVVKLPEGSRFRLPPAQWTDAVIDAYALTKGKTSNGNGGSTAAVLGKVLRCLRDYGLIVSDFAQIVGFSAESDSTYGTPYNPYAVEQRPVWGNFGQQLPWDAFVQVPPLTTSIAVQGQG